MWQFLLFVFTIHPNETHPIQFFLEATHTKLFEGKWVDTSNIISMTYIFEQIS